VSHHGRGVVLEDVGGGTSIRPAGHRKPTRSAMSHRPDCAALRAHAIFSVAPGGWTCALADCWPSPPPAGLHITHPRRRADGQNWAGRETANALFLLGNLVREFCARRKSEALELALESMDVDREEVRDSAVHLAIHLSILAQRFPQLGIKRTQAEVRQRVAQALAAGLGAEAKELR
jgi:hypothetical protein